MSEFETVLSIDVVDEVELAAEGFDVFVSVRGSSLFTGSAAFEKATEVKRLVDAVVAAGISRDDVSLVGVHVEVESGLFSKSSSAKYDVRIRGKRIDLLAETVGAIASAKSAVMSHMAWRYPETEAEQLRAAVAKAKTRAEAMADALGLALTGVKSVMTPIPSMTPVAIQREGARALLEAAPAAMRTRAVDAGVNVAPTKRVTVDVRVEMLARLRAS